MTIEEFYHYKNKKLRWRQLLKLFNNEIYEPRSYRLKSYVERKFHHSQYNCNPSFDTFSKILRAEFQGDFRRIMGELEAETANDVQQHI